MGKKSAETYSFFRKASGRAAGNLSEKGIVSIRLDVTDPENRNASN